MLAPGFLRIMVFSTVQAGRKGRQYRRFVQTVVHAVHAGSMKYMSTSGS
jgi:hypothetical protein